MRAVVFLYGLVCYGVLFGTFLYAIGFLANFGVPRSVDAGGPEVPFGMALAINVALLGLFGLQHSGMARQGFKAVWTKFVPLPAERSTYVLFSSLVLILLFWQWRPMTGIVWHVENPTGRMALWGLYAFGWALLLYVTFLINHFDLFGLRQVYLNLRGQALTPVGFKMPLLYWIVRHPLYIGGITIFWSTPDMTVGHLVLAIVATGYILVAIQFKERDLMRFYPEYGGSTPSTPSTASGSPC
jgi:protein-S-isoprenylcysteine O-methyltransferase Ste14